MNQEQECVFMTLLMNGQTEEALRYGGECESVDKAS